MIFKKKIVSPDMVDWYHDPQQLQLVDCAKKMAVMTGSEYSPQKPLIIMVGGAMDDFFRPVLEGIFVPYRLQYATAQDIIYTTHNSHKQIAQLACRWHKAGQKVCLVGHSWGGKTLFDVATRLAPEVTIDLLVTLDPVAWRMLLRSPFKPQNVTEWINVHVDYKKASHEYSNTVARLGGRWGHCRHADSNIRLSKEGDREITHVMAWRMFKEVADKVVSL